YAGGTEVRAKADASPVTAADEEAEALILRGLAELAPEVPVIAEEATAKGRLPKVAERFFLVDPLDGTKEFLKRNGEFTVNIELVENTRAVVGVVVAPAKGRAFIGEAQTAFELAAAEDLPLEFSAAQRIRARKAPPNGSVAIVSRTHRDSKTEHYLATYHVASLVAAGEADLYPRHGRTMEWDTAAGQAVLEAAGGSVTMLDGAPLTYGKSGHGFANPAFVARGLG